MTRLFASLVVGVLAASDVGARAADAQPDSQPVVARWFDALEQHTPGLNDAALERIKSLSPEAFAQIRRALGDRRKDLSTESFNRLVQSGALMHMDAAMSLAPEGQQGPSRRPRHHGLGVTAVLSGDGGFNGIDATGPHWVYGRALIDLTSPLPSEDATARLWYVAAAAFMANRSLYADLMPHLAKARSLFPTDPDVLFASGCYYEAVSSPRIRSVIESGDLPKGIQIPVPTARDSWGRAEQFFRRAVEGRPDFGAARIRRGRALYLLGRHDEAVRELREAVARPADPVLVYYAAIFEGAAQEALGSVAAARESYERAAAGFPDASAPHLALSRIARDRGDRAAAQAAMTRVFARATRSVMEDPWWTYYFVVVHNADDLNRQLREPFMRRGSKPPVEPGGKQ
jgi:tetratricopeptide (TPR) repeat protein